MMTAKLFRPAQRNMIVPTETVIVISIVVLAFVVFAGVLAWGERQTRNLSR